MSKNARLDNLFAESPYCHWCGRLTRRFASENGKQPDDAATVDHVFSRLDPRRLEGTPTVLACYECNQHRGKEEFKANMMKPRNPLPPDERALLTKEEFQRQFGEWQYDW